MQMELKTQRLRLVALRPDQLHWHLDVPERLEAELGCPISRDNVSPAVERAVGMKLANLSRVPEADYPWLTYWLVIVAGEPFGAGLAGFKGTPDAQGQVEIGYGIDPAYRGQGYTTEAVRALVDWAFAHPRCRSVHAPVHKDNPASSRVLAKCGFHVSHKTEDSLHWRIDAPPRE